ncbi:APC family permease [Actinospica sp. MGRD01-02]|uniref:APC family permease n=1 Tax=Actinospica acidithermotolerans TaxID=2828514 RepID=A0A941IJ10_9ACTN|nr:APC family permease [Actinospica acidithermotolerans]MBR7828929.1 APC family permease [Actinospica acidithermotolerans]
MSDQVQQREATPSSSGSAQLAHGALKGVDSIVMAVAGTAPGYSVSASTAVLVGAAALAGPAALLWCGIPMLGIAFAFSHLGRGDVNAGAAYSWVRKALHPLLGFISGWAVVVSATIFMVAAAVPAGQATLSLFNENKTWSTGTITAVGAIWFLVMAVIVAAGVAITTKAQWIMSAIEVAVLIVVGVAALFHESGRHGAAFSWSWFSPTHFGGVSGFAAAALVAAFYYWGWDVTANLNEESKHSKLANLGGIIGVVIVWALFELYTVDINLFFSGSDIQNQGTAISTALASAVGGSVMGKLMIVAVMLSTIATLETTLIQVSRSLFAMGRDNTLPKAFGKIDAKRRTPVIATAAVTVVSLILFVASAFIGSISTIMTDAINAIGLQIAVYYCLAALAVTVAYRKQVFTSLSNALFIGFLPLLGSAFMAFTLIENLSGSGLTAGAKWIGIGALALGLIPMAWYVTKKVPYYQRKARLASEDELEGELNGEAPIAELAA